MAFIFFFYEWKVLLTIEIGVVSRLHVSARSKIDELEIESLQIDQQVFILDITMNNALPMASHHRLDNLSEKVSGQLLFQAAFFRDEVEEVFARFRPLHDDDEGVVTLVAVDQTDHAGGAAGHQVHQTDFHGNALAIHLKQKTINIPSKL